MFDSKLLVAGIFLLVTVLVACDKGGAATEPAKSQTANESAGTLSADQIIPGVAQRPGNPIAGKRALVTQPIVSCGLPMQAYKQISNNTAYTLSGRTGDAAALPYNFNLIKDDNGVELVASNCLACHGAPLFGELVIGLGNEFLDFSIDASIAAEHVGALVSGENEIAAWEKYADRVAAIAPYMQTRSAGVNPANNLTFALMAHRDPKTMAWSDEPQLAMPPKAVPPVSVPPWWRMKKKHAMFWMGEGAR